MISPPFSFLHFFSLLLYICHCSFFPLFVLFPALPGFILCDVDMFSDDMKYSHYSLFF